MKNTLIFLNTAFDVSNIKSIPTSKGEERVIQYVEGLSKFFELNNKLSDCKIIISDNTISGKSQIDERIIEVIPEDLVEYNLKNDNFYGSKNKGAGIISSWKRSSDEMEKSEYFIHFEPRLFLKNFEFIEDFMENPRNILTLGSNQNHFNTGLFVVESNYIIEFCKSVNLEVMIEKHISLEDVLYQYFKQKNIEFDTRKEMGVIWHDSFTGLKLEM